MPRQPHIHFPAEGSYPSAILIAWPYPDSDWSTNYAEVRHCYGRFAAQLSHYARIIVLCRNQAHEESIVQILHDHDPSADSPHLLRLDYNDTWVRDYGPLTVQRDGRYELLDFRFNGWGQKYPAERDDAVNGELQRQGLFNTPVQRQSLVLEGGSIDTDGCGTLITTSSCLLTETRNPGMDKSAWERLFQQRLGIDRVLWLNHGDLIGDDTDGHVDMLARFCDAGIIAYTYCDRPDDPHFESLKAMQDQLKEFRTAEGKPYRLIPLPIPAPIVDNEDHRLPASYANFLITPKAVFVPQYGDSHDETALQRIAEAFPSHQMIGVDSRAMIHQYGSLHCATMQIPLAVLTKAGDGGVEKPA